MDSWSIIFETLICLLVCLFVDLFFGMSVGMSVGLSVGWSVNWSNGFFVGLGTSVPRLGEVPRYHVCKRGTKRGTKALFFAYLSILFVTYIYRVF